MKWRDYKLAIQNDETWREFIIWKNKKDSCKTWREHYFLHVAKKWHRENKQRNYKRNNDIIYKSTSTKRNGSQAIYEIITVKNSDLYLDDTTLMLKRDDGTYSPEITVDKVRPFDFMRMQVTDDMYLVAEIPNLILDTDFKIDNNGNLIFNYG